jgi:hypothetical protein
MLPSMGAREQHGVRDELVDAGAELVAVDTLRFYPGNARLHDDELIESSLRKHGQYAPLLVQRSTRYVIKGNGTFHSACALGWTHVGVTWADVDDQQALQIVLVDNAASDAAQNEESALAELLQQLDSYGDGLDGSGFIDSDLDELIARETARTYGDELQQPAELSGGARYSRTQVIDAALAYYRERGFPYRQLPLHECLQQIDRLAQTQGQSLRNSSLGYHVADSYHPHRFAVPIPGKKTPLQAFDDDTLLRHAFSLILDDGGAITDSSLLSTLGFVRGTQAAANFRPAFALLMWRKYAQSGDRVLDTSTGFGGRLVGFLASRCSEYVGIDPNSVTSAQNRKLADELAQSDKSVQLIEQPAEDVDVELIGRDSCGFAFTSPPYFAKERYSDEDTQSWKRYSSGEAWRDGFLRPMLQLQHDALRPGAHSVVNIADVKIGKETFPLAQWTIDCAKLVGLDYVRTDRFPLARVPGQGVASVRYEPLIVLRKPE